MPAFPGGSHAGLVVPLDRPNVDTDAIFPKQYGRSTAKSGFGDIVFDSWRYLDPGDLGLRSGCEQENEGERQTLHKDTPFSGFGAFSPRIHLALRSQ